MPDVKSCSGIVLGDVAILVRPRTLVLLRPLSRPGSGDLCRQCDELPPDCSGRRRNAAPEARSRRARVRPPAHGVHDIGAREPPCVCASARASGGRHRRMTSPPSRTRTPSSPRAPSARLSPPRVRHERVRSPLVFNLDRDQAARGCARRCGHAGRLHAGGRHGTQDDRRSCSRGPSRTRTPRIRQAP